MNDTLRKGYTWNIQQQNMFILILILLHLVHRPLRVLAIIREGICVQRYQNKYGNLIFSGSISTT